MAARSTPAVPGPRLAGPEDVVAWLRGAQPAWARTAIFLDGCQQIVAVEPLVESVMPPADTRYAVLVVRREGSTHLADEEMQAVVPALQRLSGTRLIVADVLVVAGHRWKSLATLGELDSLVRSPGPSGQLWNAIAVEVERDRDKIIGVR